MTFRRRWWVALAGTALVLVAIALSFRWIVGWWDPGYRVYVYFQHGMLGCNPYWAPSGTPLDTLPWYGAFHAYHPPAYVPWQMLPSIDFSVPSQWRVRVPLHLSLLVLLPVVAYPLLPRTIRRYRLKRGLCVGCGYDLTGNITGVCPECGVPIDPKQDEAPG